MQTLTEFQLYNLEGKKISVYKNIDKFKLELALGHFIVFLA